jgi:hypothetical protein
MGQEDGNKRDRNKRRNVVEFLAVRGTEVGSACFDEA